MRAFITILLFSFSFLFSTNYYVETTGSDNASCSVSNPCANIQTAIDLTSDGDVVIVSGGTYLENLLIETGITLKSADATDPAIIDGSSPETDPALWNGGSCIVIRTPRGASSRVTATVEDVHLTGGKGTVIIEDTNHDGVFDDSPGSEDEIKIVGGGMIIHNAGLLSRGNNIMNNGDSSTKEGGAVYAAGTGANIPDDQPADPPDDHFPNERLVIEFEETIFSSNYAQIGHTVMVNGWDPENQFIDMDFGNSQFDCIFDSEEGDELDGVSEYWVKGKDNTSFDFTGGISSEIDAIITDVWVDPTNGIDEGNTSGDQNYPFFTIDYAMSMIYPTEDNPITINLTSGSFSPSTNDESFPIILNSFMNLIGQGVELTILNAEGSIENPRTVITMEGVDEVAIESLTISGGFSVGNGGGMKIGYSDPIISNVSIKDNYAQWWGGGVSLGLSNPSMTNVTLINNSAYSGGGISLGLSNPSMTNVTLINNSARYGGGIYEDESSNIILNNVTITGNTAEYNGGGLQLEGTNSILNNVTITGNTAGNYGGGIYLVGSDNFSSLQNVIIQGNSAPAGGGAFFMDGSPILTDVSITENISVAGGGIFTQGSNFTIRNSIVSNNVSTEYGGGLLFAEDGNPYIEDTFISDNTASSGAGLYIVSNVYVNIEGGVISSNFAQYNGGGIEVSYSSVLNLDGTVIENNVSGQDGGGIYFFYSDNSQILDVTLINNSAGDEGGGIYYYQSNNPSIANSTIQGNFAATFGGGLYAFYSHNASFEDITLSENTAYSGAGAYMYYSNNPVFTRGLISNNIATNEGGGLSFFYSANPIFSYLEISGNKAYTGGGINLYNTNPLLNNMTFSGNNATYGGGGIYGYESDVDMVNSILWYDSPDEIYSVGYSELNIFFSDIENGWNGEGNIDADPLFINSETGDYTLQTDSPCIDAGITDLDGDGIDDITDYFGQAPDMGAFEFEGSSLSGDLNGDGLLNILDVVILVNIVLGYSDPLPSGDLNGDGVLNILDVVALIYIILGG